MPSTHIPWLCKANADNLLSRHYFGTVDGRFSSQSVIISDSLFGVNATQVDPTESICWDRTCLPCFLIVILLLLLLLQACWSSMLNVYKFTNAVLVINSFSLFIQTVKILSKQQAGPILTLISSSLPSNVLFTRSCMCTIDPSRLLSHPTACTPFFQVASSIHQF
jgi:hypothetical protein